MSKTSEQLVDEYARAIRTYEGTGSFGRRYAAHEENYARAALLSRIEALEADKRRLDALEGMAPVRLRVVSSLGELHFCIDAPGLHENGKDLRAAIDAATSEVEA